MSFLPAKQDDVLNYVLDHFNNWVTEKGSILEVEKVYWITVGLEIVVSENMKLFLYDGEEKVRLEQLNLAGHRDGFNVLDFIRRQNEVWHFITATIVIL